MNETPSPPKFFLRFFRWFCCPEYLEDIEGDLMERFKRNIKEKNSKTAKWRFAKDTIQLFRIELIRSVNPTYFFNHNRMILHFIKIAFRNILKDKTYSIINILGLIIGMAAVLLLAKYVGFSFTYDNFHQNSDRIFTIYQEEVKDGIIQNAGGATYYGVAQFVQENYSEIAGVTHYNFNVEALVTAQDKTGRLVKFNERKIFSADSSFFHLFSFKFIHGNSATALSEPGSVVITASTAKRYFKDVNVLGESFTLRLPWGEKKLLHVSGIIEDIPLNSKFQFDFLSSAVGILPEDNWQKPVYKTIVLLDQKS
ncbi:MAG: ABC transporter permease, partial [Bacteroidota bacterium]